MGFVGLNSGVLEGCAAAGSPPGGPDERADDGKEDGDGHPHAALESAEPGATHDAEDGEYPEGYPHDGDGNENDGMGCVDVVHGATVGIDASRAAQSVNDVAGRPRTRRTP